MENSINNDNNFFSKDPDETLPMHTKTDNIETLIGIETDGIIEELFNSRKINKRKWIFFDSVDLLYYKFHKISLNRSGSYIDHSD